MAAISMVTKIKNTKASNVISDFYQIMIIIDKPKQIRKLVQGYLRYAS